MRWKGFGFENVQSYESAYIPLNPNGLTVIEARSETGKSVYIKCLRLAIFYKYSTPEQRRIIIKRPHTKDKVGTFYIDLVDSTRVTFEFRYTSVKTIVKMPDGEERLHTGDVPKYVLDLLGLVVDYNTCLILNIMDNESPMLFDTTDYKYNDKLIGFYARHDDLINRKDFLEDELSCIGKQMLQNEAGIRAYTSRLEHIHVVDYTKELLELETRLVSIDENVSTMEQVLPILDNMYECMSNMELQTFDTSELEKVSNELMVLRDVEMIVSNIATVQEELNVYSTQELEELLYSTETLQNISYVLDSILELGEYKQTVDVDTITTLDNLVDMNEVIKKINILCDDYIAVYNSELPVLDTETINAMIECTSSNKLLLEINNLVDEISKCHDDIKECENKKVQLDIEYKETLKSFKRCALCGQEIKEV